MFGDDNFPYEDDQEGHLINPVDEAHVAESDIQRVRDILIDLKTQRPFEEDLEDSEATDKLNDFYDNDLEELIAKATEAQQTLMQIT